MNRWASVSLSPTLMLFVSPHGRLYLKLQIVFAQKQSFKIPKRQRGPKKPKDAILS